MGSSEWKRRKKLLVAGLEKGLGRESTEEERYHFLAFAKDLYASAALLRKVERGELIPRYSRETNGYTFGKV